MSGRLSRDALSRAGISALTPPTRIVHLGLGAFHRAHQAWFTAHAADSSSWGIAAFTGRSSDIADQLRPQNGLFTLLVRGDAADEAEIVSNIVEVRSGDDVERLRELLASPEVVIVTSTITEAGYRLLADGSPDESDPAVLADIRALRERRAPSTTLARLLDGLERRRLAGAGAIAIVPCDNVPGNGAWVKSGLLGFAERAGLVDAAAWLEKNVSFVSTSVDRITPRTVQQDLVIAEELTGWVDVSPTVTEPFRDWVLEGDFPAGRPRWETSGARFVDDLEPYERRKLWLLNGAHSLLAFEGLARGHRTVAQAIADPELRDAVERFWREAIANLPDDLDTEAYCVALLARFHNSRIEHSLSQIGVDGLAKVRVRVVPVLLAERASGRSGDAAARVILAWLGRVMDGSAPRDAAVAEIDRALAQSNPVSALLALLDPALATDEVLRALVGS